MTTPIQKVKSNSKNYLLLMFLSLSVMACDTSVQDDSSINELDRIPHISEVGALNMPDEIAPVNAPFDMPEFKKPVFPDFTVNIADKGARNGKKVTAHIQSAIEEVNTAGGGTVLIPKGKWKTGRIILKSNVNLHIAEGAEVYFSGELADYRPAVFTRHEGVEVMSLGACIYAFEADNIAITGKGTLYGPADGPVKDQMMTEDVVENFVPLDKPVSERIYEGYDGESIFLPMFISPTNSTNVYIEGITLEKTAFWNIVPVYCDGVIIRGVTVNSVGIPRGDGIDIESSKNVLIEYSTLNNGDDCFTMKAGRGEDGIRVNKPTENVVVRYCLAQEGHGGITVGSETAGMIRNLYVHDCVFDNTGVGIRFKTRRPRGGGGENLTYERIRMNLRHTAFRWDMLGSAMYVGELAERYPPRERDQLTPEFQHITARNIIVENASAFINVTGIPETPLKNFLLEHAEINSKKLFTAHDVDGMVLRHVNITAQDSMMYFLDARDILFEEVQFDVPGGELYTEIEGELSDDIRFKSTKPSAPKEWNKEVFKR
ncbi:glycoside hydrolase family 28 protein [Anditalea andensis]|uniref:Glycoside hydrolase n=1 Tax=Anditalea andensis TaxID=1048983 RepID=A0A074KZC7_9BACT|nr:glycoside hydrolase family 28 protein [Anditalea andensis]KEO74269.1 glycoside hydrolase [Anditalea andensis]